MSLSATMWTSVSGLIGHGKRMNTIGNNIANINTVGFKGQRMDFADFVYQNTNSLAGPTQNGFGVQVGAIMGNFSQGAFESTQESTDLAISGNGYFQVQKVGTDETYYTRSGNFRFDREGYLKDPNGYALQGWKIDNSGGVTQAQSGNPLANQEEVSSSPIVGSGVPTDIKLDAWYVFPQQTTKMDFRVNLPQDGGDKAKNTVNPFTAVLSQWDGTQPPETPNTPAIAQTSYVDETTMQIFDEAGVKHTVTVYFDKVDSGDYTGGNDGDQIWEYIVTMDPAEDKRKFFDEESGELKNFNETKMGGVLMAGTMTYNSAGALTNQSAYTWGGTQTPETNPGSFKEVPDPAGGLEPKQVINLDPTNLNNWQPAAISSDGYPIVVPNFSGILDAQTTGTENGAKYNTEINFGVKASNLSMPWKTTGSLGSLDVASYSKNPMYTPNNPNNGPEFALLNANYDATADDKWDLLTTRYQVGGTPRLTYDAGIFAAVQGSANKINYKGGGEVDFADYAKSLEYHGVTEVRLNVGSIDNTGGVNVPSQDITINLLDGSITSKDGAFNPTSGAFVYNDGARWNAAGTLYTTADGTTLNPNIPAEAALIPADRATPPTLDFGFKMGDPVHIAALSGAIKDTLNQASPKNLYLLSPATAANANYLAGFNEPAVIEANASTNLAGGFSSANAQDGYGYGDLTAWNFDADGIMHGVYSNGVTLPLWQVTMNDFVCDQGLRREGNNLFSQTKESGEPKTGAAGNAGLGKISGYSLEMSNVDMSTEFVYMIATQRGYQANSKSITTTDSMLETVINMKR